MSNPEKWEVEYDSDPYDNGPIWVKVSVLGPFPTEAEAFRAVKDRARVAGSDINKYRVKRAGSFVVVSRDLAGEFTIQCDEEFLTKEEAQTFIDARAKTLGVPVTLYQIQTRF